MRAHQIHLQLADLLGRNAHIAQLAHAGGDGIGNFIVGHHRFHRRSRLLHFFARIWRQQEVS